MEQLDLVTGQILAFEQRLRTVFAPTQKLQFLRTLPGVGWVLAVVIWLEMGDVARFPSARCASRASGWRGRGTGASSPASWVGSGKPLEAP